MKYTHISLNIRGKFINLNNYEFVNLINLTNLLNLYKVWLKIIGLISFNCVFCARVNYQQIVLF